MNTCEGGAQWRGRLTLLCVADHHELLTGISSAAHRHQQLADVLLYLELSLGDEDSGLWKTEREQCVQLHIQI